MGLRLNPGDVKSMTASAKAAIKGYNNELREALPVIRGITGEQALLGRAYTSFKFHMADHVIVVSSLIAAGEEYISCLSSIEGIVGSEVLDEDELNDGIKTCNESITTYNGHINTYRQLLNDPVYYETSASYAYSRIRDCEEMIASYEELKEKLQEKLQALHDIDAQLSSIAERMSALYEGIDAGIESLRRDWNGVAFNMPKGGKWRTDLLSRYEAEIYEILTGVKASVKGRDDVKCRFSVDPVNLATGNLIYDKDDLVIGGRTPLVFRRFYNSIGGHEGALGCDFNHNYELWLDVKEDADGQVGATIHFEDGQEDTFLQMEGDAFESYYGTTGTFERLKGKDGGACAGYVYTKLDGTRYCFDASGLYTRQEDGNGSGFSLEYENAGGAGPPRLVKIAKDTGEYFSLSYGEEGLLSEVRDHTGRCARYLYEDGRLVKAVRPDGQAIEYEYSFNGKLRKVINPRGICVLTNMYDRSDRTIRQTFPDGSVMSYSYDDENQTVTMTERNGAKSVYHHDEAYRNCKAEHANGTEEFEYNDRSQRIKVKDKNGNETLYDYDGKGNITGIVNALGTKLAMAYDRQNHLVSLEADGRSKLKNTFDARGNLVETTDAEGNKTRISYDGNGNAAEVALADGSAIGLSYDKRGNIETLTYPDGSVVSYGYDELNRVVRTTDALGNSITYKYDANDNVVEVTNPLGKSQSFAYNESNKVREITDFNGARTLYEYGVLNKPVSITKPLGNKALFEYDAMWNLSKVTMPNGGTTEYRYDGANNLTEVEDAKGAVTRYEYDANGNRTLVEDAEGNKTLLAYDALNRLVKVTSPEGGETRYEYDADSNPVKITDALGNEVSAEYDGLGRVVKETNQLGATRQYSYNALGNLKKVVGGEGGADAVTTFEYKPGTDKVTAITYPDGTAEHYGYDANNNLISFEDRGGYTIAYSYDALGRLTKSEGEEGDRKEYKYDAVGNITKVTDAHGNGTRYSYDLNGNLVRVTDALGNETAYDYDENDELVMIRQYEGAERGGKVLGEMKEGSEDLSASILRLSEERADCRITHYTRNVLGQIEAITDVFGNQERFQYNRRGELVSKLDKDGYLTKYVYTPSGDVAGIEYEDGRSVLMTYNPLRQLEEVKDWIGTTKIVNNAFGQAVSVTYPDGRRVGYEYDASGHRTALTYPDGRKASYLYDEMGRLSKLETEEHQVSYRYDARSNLVEKAFANGVKTTYSYNGRGLLESLVHSGNKGVINEFSYEYDLLGNKIKVEKQQNLSHNSNGIYRYDYDPIGRLATVSKDDSPLRSYRYDAFGNRTLLKDYSGGSSPATTHYEYNSLNQLIAKADSIGVERYSYDRRGNLTAVSLNGAVKNTYIYGAIGRLEQATNANGEIAKYLYNGLGNRVSKQMGTVPAGTFHMAEPGIPSLDDFHPERSIGYIVDLTREYDNLLTMNEGSTSSNYAFDTGLLLKGNEIFLADELTSPVGRMGRNGDVIAHAAYDEFGIELGGHVDDDFTFTGYMRDAVAGTYFAQAREYVPSAARFAGTDLVAGFALYPFSLNRYTYCYNQPIDYVDRDGKLPIYLFPIALYLHYNRNSIIQSEYENMSKKEEQELIDEIMSGQNGWHELSPEQSIYHQFDSNYGSERGVEGITDTSNNRKFVRDSTFFTSQEIIIGTRMIRGKKELYVVRDPINAGTGNYFDVNKGIIGLVGHGLFDVLPYYLWSNGKGDNTNMVQRILGPEKYNKLKEIIIQKNVDGELQCIN